MASQPAATFVPIAFGTNDVQIMAGSFDDVTFDDVIQVLGLSRQCLRLLVRRGEQSFSEVLLKAGQVLDARMLSSSDPDQVFYALNDNAVRGSGLSFTVYHTQPTGPFPAPRARLSDLYARAKQGVPDAPTTSSILRAAEPAPEPTLRLTPTELRTALMPGGRAAPAPAPVPMPPAQAAPTGAQPDHPFPPTATMPAMTVSSDVFSKAVLADLQPVLRQEMDAALVQLREHSQALHTLDGRLQALPQLMASEIRLALAQQQERQRAPAPAPAPQAQNSSALIIGLVAGFVVLFGMVIVLALKVLR